MTAEEASVTEVIPTSTSEIRRSIEAILMVADEPISPRQLALLIGCSSEDIEVAAAALIQSYADDQRGFVLQRVAGGFRFQSHPDMASIVERFVLDGQAARLSAAALETMAIIAYKQPISRNQISAIRGVNAEGVVRTLEARGYVEEIARDPGPGRASLYGTTPTFLERLGLNSVDELPPLGQFVPDADVVEALETTLLVNPEGAGAVDATVQAAVAAEDAGAFETAMANSAADEVAADEVAADEYGEDQRAEDQHGEERAEDE
ncbi:MAG: SMC-Scp complex subunit ScpB [Actinomycetota bacterium]